jgi:hypothetical protein
VRAGGHIQQEISRLLNWGLFPKNSKNKPYKDKFVSSMCPWSRARFGRSGKHPKPVGSGQSLQKILPSPP